MIESKFFLSREDGVKLYRKVSTENVMIRETGTDHLYSEAIDPENVIRQYEETDIPIEHDAELTLEDTLEMLGELGVDVDD